MPGSFAKLLERQNRSLLKRAAGSLLPRRALRLLTGLWYRWRFTDLPDDVQSHLHIITHLVSPGDIVVDLGANIGQYTMALSRLVGQHGKVIAFEPVLSTYQMMVRNLRAYHVTNTDLRRCAVSDHSGKATMAIPRFEWGGDAHYLARIVGAPLADADEEQVPCDTLTGVLGDLSNRVTFIKCDIEGHETAALRAGPAFSNRPRRLGSLRLALVILLGHPVRCSRSWDRSATKRGV
jgi:FkbM family methyltransferase